MSAPSGAAAALDQVTIAAAEPSASAPFFDAAFAALGWQRVTELVDEEEDAAPVEAIAWGPGSAPQVWLVVAGAGPVTAGLHLRIVADSRVQVETFHAAAVAAGGTSQVAPRRWTPYRRGEFHAAVRDGLGNVLEAVTAE